MKTIHTNAKYVEWLSAEEMHKGSQDWLSELRFIKDEHLFFEDLIKSFTLQLIEPAKFSHNNEIIDAISKSKKRNELLIRLVKTHEKKLNIMVDGINQPNEENDYKKEHRELITSISTFRKEYRLLKTQLFDIIKKIKKEDKHRYLIDKI